MDKITPFASKCRQASPHDTVLNSECAFTFHTPFSPNGILVNLQTFIGTIDKLALANESQGIFVRIIKKRIPKKVQEEKVTKLGIGIEGGFEKDAYEEEATYSIVVLSQEDGCTELPYNEETKNDFPMNVTASVESIIHHAGAAVQQDLQAFELDQEKPVSKYAASLEFVDNGVTISPNPSDWKCEKSGDTENIWLNLSDGYIGGGRKNWDGSGGSNGALDHFNETGQKYPLVVKLGTITEDITSADCYSYAPDEDGPVIIPNLKDLLMKRGINVAGMQKTVKSTAELEVELNANYAFDAITEAGAKLVPISGAGYQGLQNLGNSCYINSVMQMLLSGVVTELASRYGTSSGGDVTHHPLLKVDPVDAPTDLLCQTAKLGCALTSGEFAVPVTETEVDDSSAPSKDPQYRIPPRMFKHLIGKGHVDFCTGQQQDAAQFLQYFLEKIDEAEVKNNSRLQKDDTNSEVLRTATLFAHKTTSRLVCSKDGKVKYKDSQPESVLSLRVPMEKGEVISKSPSSTDSEPEEKRQKAEKEIPTVSFNACLDSWAEAHTIDGLRWSHLDDSVAGAVEETKFGNFPRYLIVQIQRYELGPDWTPRKLEVNIDVPGEVDLTPYKCSGPLEGEDLVAEDTDIEVDNSGGTNESTSVSVDESAVAQLMDMGFSMNGCIRALHATGGSNVELAMNWIFEHNGDPDFNDPLPATSTTPNTASTSAVDESVVSSLVANLGMFTADQVRAALEECSGSADRAADWLFSNMDDLDGAIARLQSKKEESNTSSGPAPTVTLEDGEGKYSLVGIVSHIGKNTGSGHYVAHLKKDNKWVIFNDENVALSEKPPIQHAYLYLFQRMDTIGKASTYF